MSPSGIHRIGFKRDGEPVRMEMFIERSQIGAYEISAHDASGEFETLLLMGNNVDNMPDDISIPTAPEELDGRHVIWTIVVDASEDPVRKPYFTRVSFTQDGLHLDGSPIERRGSLSGSRFFMDVVRFEAR